MRPLVVLLVALLTSCAAPPKKGLDRGQASDALRRAARFFHDQVSTEGGYHFQYTSDLSFGRSESAQGPTQISVQRAGTPSVGMALLEAYQATREVYLLELAVDAARALVQGQHCTGGWDYIVELDPTKRAQYSYRADGPCEQSRPGVGYTTLDDNVSQAAMRLLMRVDRELGLKDESIHGAVVFGLERLIEAQYENGAWPQRYAALPHAGSHPPLRASYPDDWSRQWPDEYYRGFYTLNDNTLADLIDMFLEAGRIYAEPRYVEAAKRGGDFLLNAQMPDPQPAWAQQYDYEMRPVWARQFEPASITGGESLSALKILLTLYRETGEGKYLDSLSRAIEYLKASSLPDDPDAPRRRARTCPPGDRCLARFYELKTNRPLFITKGPMYRVAGLDAYRPEGYEVSYDDSSTIQHYAMWVNGRRVDEAEAELARVREAPPEELRREERLTGLSPWQDSAPDAPRDVARIIAAMDERGAWVEPGFAGRSDRLVSVFAAEDMTVRIGGRTIALPEDETVEIFRGAPPVVEEMIVSETFAENIEALARWIAARPRH